MSRLAQDLWALLLGQEDSSAVLPARLLVDEQLAGLAYYRLWLCNRGQALSNPQLQMEYRATAGANLRMLCQLGSVLGKLGSLRRKIMVLPGAAVLPLYPDLGCRPMDVVDLLIPSTDYDAVVAALLASGLQPVVRHPGLLTQPGLTLDLHRDPLNADRIPARSWGGGLDVENLWGQARRTQLHGVEVLVPGVPDMILYTAAHAVRHGYSRLTWLVDLALLMQDGADWSGLVEHARRCGLMRPLADGLYLLEHELGTALPAAVRSWMTQASPGLMERALLTRAYRDGVWGEWGDLLWSFGIPQVGLRMRFLLATAFPRPEVLMQVFPFLPRRLAPLAYVLRLMQLVTRTVGLGTHLLRRWIR